MSPKRKDRKTLAGIGPVLTASFAGFQAPPPQELVDFVGRFGWDRLLVQLAGLSATMTNLGGPEGVAVGELTTDVLLRADASLLSLRYAREFQPYLRTLQSVPPLASDAGFLFLQALAILHGQDGGPSPSQPELAEMLLYANEYAFSWRDDAATDMTTREKSLADIARARTFNRRSDLAQNIVRSNDMFRHRPKRCGAWGSDAGWAAFQLRALGMTLDEYLEGHVVPLVIVSHSWGLPKSNNNYEGPIVDPAVWYSQAQVDPKAGQGFLSHLAITRDEARKELQRHARDGMVLGPALFYRKPGVWLPNGNIVMLSPWLVREHMRGGLWGRHRAAALDRQKELWPSAFGEIFEDSCHRAAAIAGRASVDEIVVPTAPGTDDELEDILIRKNDKLVIVSVKASSIPEQTLRGAKSRQQVRDWFDQFLFAGRGTTVDGKPHRGGALRLLDRKISALRAGQWEARGFPRNLKVYPMVVAYEQCFDSPALYRWCEQQCHEIGLFQQGRVEPVVFSTVDDFESMLALGTHGQSAADILRQKAGYAWRHAMFGQLLHTRKRSDLDLRLPQVTEAFEQMVVRCTDRLFGPNNAQ